MTDWGDYTPGPWRWSKETLVNHWLIGGDKPVLSQINWIFESDARLGRCDARLISKAYLIPRLDAAIERWVAYDEMYHHGKEGGPLLDESHALLAELRTEP